MTGPSTAASGAGRRRPGDVLRGLGALLVLLALLVGLPVLLYTVAGAPIPHRVPSPGQITDTLTRRDNGQLFLACLLLLAWAGWAAFAASVAVETLAQLRGRGAPRLLALGGVQRLAGHLVAAVAIAFLGAGPLLTPTISAQASATVPVRSPVAATSFQVPATAELPPPASPASPGSTAGEPAPAATPRPAKDYTVQRGDTLWGIAETHLGDPERYHDIARLNYGRPQPDGRALTDAHWIYPGWTLLLPADATGLPAPTAPDGADQHHQPDPDGTSSPPAQEHPPETGHQQSSPAPTASPAPTPSPAIPTPTQAPTASRPQPSTTINQPPAGRPTGEADHPDGISMPGWAEAPLVAVSVASGLATALTVLRLRRRHSYRPSPPAPSTTGPQSAPRVRRLAATPTRARSDDPAEPVPDGVDGQRTINASLRRLSEVEIGRCDEEPVTIDLLDEPGLAVTGPGAEPALRSLLADLLARARRYELQVLVDPPAAERLLPETLPVGDMLQRTHDAAGALMEAETACVARSRRLAEAGVADYAGYRETCPDDPLSLLVLILSTPPASTAGQLTALLAVGRRLGITALLLGEPPAGMATVDVAADGQLVTAEPATLHSRLHGARLAGLSADDAGALLSALCEAVPGDLPSTRPTPAPHAVPVDAVVDCAAASQDQRDDGRPGATDAPETTRQPSIRVQLLGPIRITAWGEEIATGLRGTARELLTYYLLQPDGATAEAATDALWPDADTERGRQRFWTALGNLRSRLRGPTGSPEIQIIAKHGEHYRADPDLLHVDLWQFQAALADAQHANGDPQAEAAALQCAFDVYRGDLADGADYSWAEAAREDLHRRALDALIRLSELQSDDPQQAISCLERAIALDPYAEEIYRRLIGLHTDTGRPDAARRAYQQLRDRLTDLDLEPEPATTAMITLVTGRSARPEGTRS